MLGLELGLGLGFEQGLVYMKYKIKNNETTANLTNMVCTGWCTFSSSFICETFVGLCGICSIYILNMSYIIISYMYPIYPTYAGLI